LARPITNIRTEIRETELKNIDPTKTGCIKDPASNLTW
jgi:integrin alpha 7